MSESIKLFCDGSVNPQKKIGIGAYFILEDDTKDIEEIKTSIQTKRFENTSSTKLELEVLLWALEEINFNDKSIEVYTDCQNILGLEERREKLEKNSFKSSSRKLLNNSELYKEFYKIIDLKKCNFIKVKGHKASNKKDDVDRLFNLVDKASRKYLREYLNR